MVGVYQVKREQRRIAQEGFARRPSTACAGGPFGRWRLWSGLACVVLGGAAGVVGHFFPGLLRPAPAVELSPEIVFLAGIGVGMLGLFLLVLWLDTVRHARRYRAAFAAAEKGRRTELRGLEESEEVARRAVVQSLRGLPVRGPVAGSARVRSGHRDRTHGGVAGRRAEPQPARRPGTGRDPGRGPAGLAYEERLLGLGDGDAGRGAETARRRLDALQRANQLRAELERGHPALADIENRIREADEAGERWESLAERLGAGGGAGRPAGAKGRGASGSHGQSGFRDPSPSGGRHGWIAWRAASRPSSGISGMCGRAGTGPSLLARIVRVADRRFRDRYQPDLLHRAGGHLRHLTRSRYDEDPARRPGGRVLLPARPCGKGAAEGGRDPSPRVPGSRSTWHSASRSSTTSTPTASGFRSSWTRRWSTGTPGAATAHSSCWSGWRSSARSSSSPATRRWRRNSRTGAGG